MATDEQAAGKANGELAEQIILDDRNEIKFNLQIRSRANITEITTMAQSQLPGAFSQVQLRTRDKMEFPMGTNAGMITKSHGGIPRLSDSGSSSSGAQHSCP